METPQNVTNAGYERGGMGSFWFVATSHCDAFTMSATAAAVGFNDLQIIPHAEKHARKCLNEMRGEHRWTVPQLA
jgi:hypothetical protein